MNAILKIIETISTDNPALNPTAIYNEGWMTRLLVHYSIKEKIVLHDIDFSKIRNNTSEALIDSPFVHASKYREGYTHADMVLGDFTVNFGLNGKQNNKALLFDKFVDCNVKAITYEYWIDLFKNSETKETLYTFYEECKKWNKI